MTVVSSSDKALLRTRPHETKLYMSIYKPTTQFAAQVNDASIAVGEQEINYNNVTTGSYTNIRFGATMLVGSTPGASDKGSIYVYKTNPLFITVGENNHINWEDDDYITVINFHQIFPIYPSYSLTGSNYTVLKAYDAAYTDQNTVLGAFVCMGSHYAGFMEDGSHTIFYTASGTSHVKGSALTYSWIFEGGTPTGSTAHSPGNVTYDTPGHYSTVLTVQDGSGTNVGRGIRHISLYDRFGEGSTNTIQNWELEILQGDRAEGGYKARIRVQDDIDDIQDGALVVLFYENWYGGTKQNIGGNAQGRDSIFFTGYILGHTIEFDYQTSSITFEVGSPTEVMKLAEAFNVSVEDSADPVAQAEDELSDPWFYLDGLTLKTALFHYLRWHSNTNNCTDIEFVMTDYDVRFFEPDRQSLFDACQSWLESTRFARIVCDRQGKIFFDHNSESLNNAASVIPTSMDLQNHDWINRPIITEVVVPEYAYIQFGGNAYERGVQDASLIASAPGEIPGYRGKKELHDGLVLVDQSDLNTLAGNVLANRNARFPDVAISLAGNYSNFDIAPLEKVAMYLSPEMTFRKLNWEGKAFSVEAVTWNYDAENGLLLPDINLREITQGYAGEAIPIPEVPPTDGQDQPETTIYIPPIPDIPSFEFPTGGGGVNVAFGLPHKYTEYVGGSPASYSTDEQDYYYVPMFSAADSYSIFGVMRLPSGSGNWEVYPIISSAAAGTIDGWQDTWAGELGGSTTYSETVGFVNGISIPAQASQYFYSMSSLKTTVPSLANIQLVELTFECNDLSRNMNFFGWVAVLV